MEHELFRKSRAGVKYFIVRLMVVFMGRCAAVAPEILTYFVCTRLALLAYRYAPRFRRLAREHLEIAFGNEKTPGEIDDILRRTYINHGKNLAEFLMIPYKSSEWVLNKVKFSDPFGRIDAELAKGKGAIVLSAHSGSMELACAWIGIKKFPMVSVVKAQRDDLFMKFVMETRRKWGTKLILREKGVRRECLRQLGLNKIVGLVGDQNAASHGVYVDFFGKKAATPTGAADMAVQAGIPVLFFMVTRNPDDTSTVHMLESIQMRNTGDKAADTLHNVQLYTTEIERFVRRHPEDYLWWHRRWKTRPANDARVSLHEQVPYCDSINDICSSPENIAATLSIL